MVVTAECAAALAVGFLATDEAALVVFRADVFGVAERAGRPAVLLRGLVPVPAALAVGAVFRAVVLVAGRVDAAFRVVVFAAGRVDVVLLVVVLVVVALPVLLAAVVLDFLAAGRVVVAFRTVVLAAERVAAVFLTAAFVAVAFFVAAFTAGRVAAVAFLVAAFLAVAFAAGRVTALLRAAVFVAGRVVVVLVAEPAEVFFAAALVAVPVVVARRVVVALAAARVLAAPSAAGRFATVFPAARVAGAFFAVVFFAAGRPVVAVLRAPTGFSADAPAALADPFAARGAGIFAAPDRAFVAEVGAEVVAEPERLAAVAVRPARVDTDFAAAEAVLLAEATLLVALGVWAGLVPARGATLLRARSEADLAATDAVLFAEATLRVAVVFAVVAGEVRFRGERAAVAVATGRATRSPAGCVAAVVVFEGTVPPG